MTIEELKQRYSEEILPHEKDLIGRKKAELHAAGLCDELGVPSKAGEYIIPLLLYVNTINNRMIRLISASIVDDDLDDDEGEPATSETHELMKNFGNLLNAATTKVEEVGYENARDLVMGATIPEMNSFFALNFVWLLTEVRCIDIIDKDPSLAQAFEGGGLNNTSFQAIAMYRSLAAEHGDKWAVMIADTAKMFWGRASGH